MTNEICPLRLQTLETGKEARISCLKQKCAWWLERQTTHKKTGCALKILALSMEIFVSEQKRFIMAMEKHR